MVVASPSSAPTFARRSAAAVMSVFPGPTIPTLYVVGPPPTSVGMMMPASTSAMVNNAENTNALLNARLRISLPITSPSTLGMPVGGETEIRLESWTCSFVSVSTALMRRPP